MGGIFSIQFSGDDLVRMFSYLCGRRYERLERPTGPTIGHEVILEKAWKRLMDKDKIGIMGLHGLGGVGKTTLFNKIHNKVIRYAGEFKVIWVVVSQGAMISKIQDDIAQKLYICDEEWSNKNESDKAADIYRVLKGKKFILMLDDVWKEVNLEAIGVPIPTRENEYKVAFTTRSREVCARMGDHEPMQVECLEPKEAWELFKNMVGDNLLRNDPAIEQLARKVADKCGGLPMSLSVIGKTMAPKDTIQEWEHAIDVLTRSAAEYPNVEKVLSILKYSYDSLGDENIKSCFLYCALFPEDYMMVKERLIEYWICEGFMGDSPDIKEAMNKGYEVLGTLIRTNLLMEKSGTLCVMMHDVVREMALWIAPDFDVQANVRSYQVPKLKDVGAVRRMSFIGYEIEQIRRPSEYSELTTLFLQKNNLKYLSGEFIKCIQKLVVLDLSENRDFEVLPEQISKLVYLKFLNLSYTSIEELPDGFQELKKLIVLNLSNTSKLCSIKGISKVSSLRILDLTASNVHGNITFLEELQQLKHLQVLRIIISTQLGLEKMLYHQRLANSITALHILGFQQQPLNISLLVRMVNLRHLRVEYSHFSTDMEYRENTSFSNLFSVWIKECTGIKDLTWLLFAPNLARLCIDGLKEVEVIINKEKATNLTNTPFQKLQTLQLFHLPQLKSIYWSPLPFPFLIKLVIMRCPKLRKLPLNASSAPRAEDFRIGISSRNQLNDFEWEDEDTKNHFLPFLFDMGWDYDEVVENDEENTETLNDLE